MPLLYNVDAVKHIYASIIKPRYKYEHGAIVPHVQEKHNMDIEIIAYAAGLVDGEGTITLTRNAGNEKRSPTVSMSSTTYELVDFMKQNFGGRISMLSARKKAHHKQAWHWQNSHNGAIDVIRQVFLYLREPEKKRRAELILTQFASVTSRNGKYTDEMLTQRQLFEDEFFKNSSKFH